MKLKENTEKVFKDTDNWNISKISNFKDMFKNVTRDTDLKDMKNCFKNATKYNN